MAQRKCPIAKGGWDRVRRYSERDNLAFIRITTVSFYRYVNYAQINGRQR